MERGERRWGIRYADSHGPVSRPVNRPGESNRLSSVGSPRERREMRAGSIAMRAAPVYAHTAKGRIVEAGLGSSSWDE